LKVFAESAISAMGVSRNSL